jgi:luciferase family oxidoreductase group 1
MATARALRRHMEQADSFPQDVTELISYLDEDHPEARVRAVPGVGTQVPVWILGSSLYGAQLAAWLGLPYAFASHFAPQMLGEALDVYRRTFRPSQWLDAPHAMMGVGVCAAETDAEAELLRSSQLLAFARLRMGRPGKLPEPTADLSEIPAGMRAEVEAALSCSAVGSRATVTRQMQALLARYQPDEVMVTGMIHDHAARLRSFEIASEVLAGLVGRAVAA